MDVIEVLNELCGKEFQWKFLPKFKEAMCQNVIAFVKGINLADKFDRGSDEYKVLTRYHVEATKDKNYMKLYKLMFKIADEKPEAFTDPDVDLTELLEE